MHPWEKTLAGLTRRIERHVDRAKAYVAEAIPGDRHAVRVEPYRGYGTPSRLLVRGRVLRGAAASAAADADSVVMNLANMIQRFESDEVAGEPVVLAHGGRSWNTHTDREGYFQEWIDVVPSGGGPLWEEVAVHLPAREGAEALAHVLVPPADAAFGVVSDLDDTVIQTGATSPLRMARTVLLGNARTRTPFPGVGAFYRALQRGAGAATFNPIFYVSSSPWNLHDLLTDFLTLQKIPLGPLVLRDWGISHPEMLPTRHGAHKLAAIRSLLDCYPALPFLLIGDSGQEDPEIYHRVVHDYPGRIAAVYIRDVSGAPMRRESVRRLAEEVASTGATLHLTDDTLGAAEHALSKGWIEPEALEEVCAEQGVSGS